MLKRHTCAHCCKTMLLALLRRTVLEIVFCFTYCKMNQRFILWRLLFCWYIQYDRYIYIEYEFYLYLMQYVNLMMMRISGWLFTCSWRKVEHRATWKLPHFLFRLAKQMSFCFYAKSTAALSASRRELWEMFLEIFPSCFVVPHKCEYDHLKIWQTGRNSYKLKFFWTWKSLIFVGAVRPLSGVWPANVNKQRAVGLLFWRVCCDAVMLRLSRLRVAPNTLRKGIFFFFCSFWLIIFKVLNAVLALGDFFFFFACVLLNISHNLQLRLTGLLERVYKYINHKTAFDLIQTKKKTKREWKWSKGNPASQPIRAWAGWPKSIGDYRGPDLPKNL